MSCEHPRLATAKQIKDCRPGEAVEFRCLECGMKDVAYCLAGPVANPTHKNNGDGVYETLVPQIERLPEDP